MVVTVRYYCISLGSSEYQPLLRGPQVLRISRLVRLRGSREETFSWYAIIRLFAIVLLLCHYIACLWWFIEGNTSGERWGDCPLPVLFP